MPFQFYIDRTMIKRVALVAIRTARSPDRFSARRRVRSTCVGGSMGRNHAFIGSEAGYDGYRAGYAQVFGDQLNTPALQVVLPAARRAL
jgi:hypothetical protein